MSKPAQQQPSTESIRQRRFRARQKAGRVVVQVEVGDDVVESLIGLRWLALAASENRASVGRAIGAMLADMAQAAARKIP